MTPLETTVWKRMAVFIAVLALLIFLPAWTPRYWQGWLFLIVFCTATIATSAYFPKHDPALAQRRLNAGAAAETESSQKIIQAFTSVFVMATFVLSAFDYGRGWSSVPALLSVAANGCMLLGYYIIFQTFKANTFAASTIQVEQTQRVISSGPYAVVRHPMYSGALLMFVAMQLRSHLIGDSFPSHFSQPPSSSACWTRSESCASGFPATINIAAMSAIA